MSERPTAHDAPATATPRAFTPDPFTDPTLRGTTITWEHGGGAKLVIDDAGIATFTDPAGETGMWDPSMGGWVDPDTGELKYQQFGIDGFELTNEQKEALAQQLDVEAAEMASRLAADPGMAYTMPEFERTMQKLADRAASLHQAAATPTE